VIAWKILSVKRFRQQIAANGMAKTCCKNTTLACTRWVQQAACQPDHAWGRKGIAVPFQSRIQTDSEENSVPQKHAEPFEGEQKAGGGCRSGLEQGCPGIRWRTWTGCERKGKANANQKQVCRQLCSNLQMR